MSEPLTFEQYWQEHYARRHQAARCAEEQHLDEAFAGCTHTVCGLELRGLSAYDLLLLHGCGNPFVTGGDLRPADIAQFLAILVEPAAHGWLARRRFFRHVANYPYLRACAELKAYVARMFSASGWSGAAPDSGAAPVGNPAINLCFLAPLVIRVAAETGWAESDILSMRIDRLFQYQRAIDLRAGGKLPFAPSDKLISEALGDYANYLANHAA